MTIHLLGGVGLAVLAIATAAAFLVRRAVPRATLAAWALALLLVQVATGMLLLTATNEGPGPVHVAVPLAALAVAGAARFFSSMRGRGGTAVLSAAYAFVAFAALVALATGLAGG